MASSNKKERGSVYTRREVVEFILDLAGYRPEFHLWESSLLEPSFGEGDFLIPCVERLLESVKRAGVPLHSLLGPLAAAVRGVELHAETHQSTAAALVGLLSGAGLSEEAANNLVKAWLSNDDFLLWPTNAQFDFVVGNPPYLRLEWIPEELLREYYGRFATMTDRTDLYIPFIERGIRLLKKNGTLAFICSDRWLKNAYGRRLREVLSSGFSLEAYVDMAEMDAFHETVAAYAGVFVIQRRPQTTVAVARKPSLDAQSLRQLAKGLTAKDADGAGMHLSFVTSLPNDGSPWLLDGGAATELIRTLEARLPTLEEAGCKVSIGVATGCDGVYIGMFDGLPVESERILPLVMAADLQEGEIRWSGHGVVNPFNKDGSLASFSEYPRFGAYMEAHGAAIRRRNVAKRSPGAWYRTIDRIYPDLVGLPKILVPDIKNEPSFVVDSGMFYPHHNIYYIVSLEWELVALCNLLRSRIAKAFISAYSVKMRGGYLRFQAQNLRRIRVPRWGDVPSDIRRGLSLANPVHDVAAIERLACEAYGLTAEQMEAEAASGVGAR